MLALPVKYPIKSESGVTIYKDYAIGLRGGKYVEAGIEEICDWESDSSPIVYIYEGEKILIPDKIIPKKITHIYKKVTPLDIQIEV